MTSAGCQGDRRWCIHLACYPQQGARTRTLLDILANDDRPGLSAVTLYETMLIVGARRGPDNLDDVAAILEAVEAEVAPFDADQARASQAACMRYGKGMSSDSTIEPLRLRCICACQPPRCAVQRR